MPADRPRRRFEDDDDRGDPPARRPSVLPTPLLLLAGAALLVGGTLLAVGGLWLFLAAPPGAAPLPPMVAVGAMGPPAPDAERKPAPEGPDKAARDEWETALQGVAGGAAAKPRAAGEP